jgi:hypothetical protein
MNNLIETCLFFKIMKHSLEMLKPIGASYGVVTSEVYIYADLAILINGETIFDDALRSPFAVPSPIPMDCVTIVDDARMRPFAVPSPNPIIPFAVPSPRPTNFIQGLLLLPFMLERRLSRIFLISSETSSSSSNLYPLLRRLRQKESVH